MNRQPRPIPNPALAKLIERLDTDRASLRDTTDRYRAFLDEKEREHAARVHSSGELAAWTNAARRSRGAP